MDKEKIEQLEHLIQEGKDILNTAKFHNGHFSLEHLQEVDDNLFVNWYHDVKVFLNNNNFKDYIVDEPKGMKRTNFHACKEQVDKLELLQNLFA